MVKKTTADFIIAGGGIVGCATAYQLSRARPDLSIILLEKEGGLARHQTGRNSGVIHSGIYYKPGSLKAENCRAGKILLEEFCRAEGLTFETCGKVVVAVDESELPALERIHERAQKNGVPCEMIDERGLHEIEPAARGVRALNVPGTGIIDYAEVTNKLAAKVRAAGQEVRTGIAVTGVKETAQTVVLHTSQGDFETKLFINCGGLHSDRIARFCGVAKDFQIVPFRGEYYEVSGAAAGLCRNLIYPVPDPEYPFLGVHFTRMVKGGVECGPNAVFAFGREAYQRTQFNVRDLAAALSFSGFWRFTAKHWRMGAAEMWRSWNKAAFVRALQRLVPAIEARHLTPGHAGIRAQALKSDGKLVDDFVIEYSERSVHLLNAPSPAATASLKIGLTVAEKALSKS